MDVRTPKDQVTLSRQRTTQRFSKHFQLAPSCFSNVLFAWASFPAFCLSSSQTFPGPKSKDPVDQVKEFVACKNRKHRRFLNKAIIFKATQNQRFLEGLLYVNHFSIHRGFEDKYVRCFGIPWWLKW